MRCGNCQKEHELEHPCSNAPFPPNAPASPVDGLVGRQLGSFRLLHRLGAGGMGSVYLAEHVVIGSRVAVKVLHPSLSSDPAILQRFHDEARAVNLIGHDNILKIYDLCREGDLHYLIMEYLEGRPLSKLAAPLPKEVAIPILAQVCDALAAAHDHGVVHRDLKPENVFLVERRGRPPFVKLLDFGVAKLLQDAGRVTAVGLVVGTPSHMAPEQFRGDPLDGRADLYALGVLSYQLATGILPFGSGPITSLMRDHLQATPTPPAALCPSVDRRWSEVTLRALAKRPEDRYQDARAFRADLLSVVDLPEPRTAPIAPAPAPRVPRSPSLSVSVLAADGSTLHTASGSELSKDGIFLGIPAFTPPLFSTLRIAIRGPLGGGTLRLEGEVVRHVSASQAQAWGMSEGVGVQFTRLTEAHKRGLSALLRGEPIPADTPVPPPEGEPDPEAALAPLRRRAALAGPDPYLLLDASTDADASDIRSRAREWRRLLAACQTPRATPQQRVEAEALLDRLSRAVQTLTDPARRAELDASRGNPAGVARAIAQGLTVTELERLRRRFLEDRPNAAGCAALEAATARAYEEQGNLEAAAQAYERALLHDPLDLALHQRFARVRRQRAGAPACAHA